jgi:hypothetical protein
VTRVLSPGLSPWPGHREGPPGRRGGRPAIGADVKQHFAGLLALAGMNACPHLDSQEPPGLDNLPGALQMRRPAQFNDSAPRRHAVHRGLPDCAGLRVGFFSAPACMLATGVTTSASAASPYSRRRSKSTSPPAECAVQSADCHRTLSVATVLGRSRLDRWGSAHRRASSRGPFLRWGQTSSTSSKQFVVISDAGTQCPVRR